MVHRYARTDGNSRSGDALIWRGLAATALYFRGIRKGNSRVFREVRPCSMI